MEQNRQLACAEGAAAKPVQDIQDSRSRQLVQQQQQQQQMLTAFDLSKALHVSTAGQSTRALHKLKAHSSYWLQLQRL